MGLIGVIDPQGRIKKKLKIKKIVPTLRKETHGNLPLLVFTQANGTNMQTASTENTLENAMTETSEQYQPQKSQTTTYSLEECPVNRGRLQEKEVGLTMSEEICGLNVLGYLEQNSLNTSSLKMLKDCSHMTEVKAWKEYVKNFADAVMQ